MYRTEKSREHTNFKNEETVTISFPKPNLKKWYFSDKMTWSVFEKRYFINK